RAGARAVAFAPAGRPALPGRADAPARLWDASTGEALGPDFVHRGRVGAVAFSADGRTVLTGSADNTARVWDVATRKPLGPPLGHRGTVQTVAFGPDGKTILTGTASTTARLWRIEGPLEADVGRVSLWAQVVTGKELDARGALREIDARTWSQRRQRLEELGGPPVPPGCPD